MMRRNWCLLMIPPEFGSHGQLPPMPFPKENDGVPVPYSQRPKDSMGNPEREWWEYEPSHAHRSLVLMLYRNILKELLVFPSVRRKSLTAFCRLAFRRRAKATEKLLIDECIEEARRAVYVLSKHNDMKTTREYKYDDMFMPKDTGQDVKTYMEEVYDPAQSRAQFQHVKDVQPGKEHEHGTMLRGSNAGKGYMSAAERAAAEKQMYDDTQSRTYFNHRPPPPPRGTRHEA